MAKAKGATTNSIKPIWRSDWKRKKVWNPIEKSSKNLESWRDEWWMHYVYRNYYTSIDMKPFSLKQATIAQVDMEIRRSKNVIVGHICLENCDSHKIHFNLTLPSSWCSGKYVKKTLLLHEKETSSSWRVAFSTYPFRFKTCPLLCFLYIPIKSRNAFHLPIRNGRSLWLKDGFTVWLQRAYHRPSLNHVCRKEKLSVGRFPGETGSAFNIQLAFKIMVKPPVITSSVICDSHLHLWQWHIHRLLVVQWAHRNAQGLMKDLSGWKPPGGLNILQPT